MSLQMEAASMNLARVKIWGSIVSSTTMIPPVPGIAHTRSATGFRGLWRDGEPRERERPSGWGIASRPYEERYCDECI